MLSGVASKFVNLVVEVRTIDSCQGQERDFVIISVARSFASSKSRYEDLWFLHDRYRLNVCITRARFALWVVCNKTSLEASWLEEDDEDKELEWCRRLMQHCGRKVRGVSPNEYPQIAVLPVTLSGDARQAFDWEKHDFSIHPLQPNDDRLVRRSAQFADRSDIKPDSSFRTMGICTQWPVQVPFKNLRDNMANQRGQGETFRVFVGHETAVFGWDSIPRAGHLMT